MHPEDRPRQIAATVRADRGEAPYDAEYRIIRPGGEARHVHSAGEVIWDESGRPRRAFGVIQDITVRKRAEEENCKQAEVLQKIFDNAPIALNFFDESGHPLLVNRPWERMFGWTLQELNDQKRDIYTEFVPDPQERELAREFVAAAAGEWVDFRVRTRDGRTINTSAAVVLLSDKTRIALAQDITERKRAEQELRQSERRLNESQRIAHIGHWEWDLDADRITASDEVYRMFGLAPQEDLRTWAAWQAHVHPEDRARRAAVIDRARRAAVIDRARREESRFETDYRAIRPDGEIRFIRGEGEILRDESGRPRRLFGIVRDVTEHSRAEEARHVAERRLEHIVATSPAILFSLPVEDGEFRAINWMSENVEAVFGYQVDETLGSDWWLVNIHPEDRDAVVNQFLAEIFSSGHVSAEYRFRHKNGQYRWLRGETRLLRDDAGQPTEVVGSLSDITVRKRLEDQFRQAQKMEAVGHLAGGVAHDFNNLLTIISGYSEILLPELPPDDPKREMIAQIRDAGERAAGLTRQLLAFSRQMVLEPKVLDLNDVVRENERMLRRLIGEDVRLTAALDPAVDPVKVDPGQIGQVIMNLAVNARDAMPTGGKLTIETGNVVLDEAAAAMDPDAKPGRYVRLSVTDTGTGMTADIQAHLFEPFFTTKGPGKGTGLGLGTVYGIVKQSGGFISVSSEPGRGAAFKIYLPVAEGRVPTGNSLPGLKPMVRGTETILLVEDEDAVRAMVQVVLQQAGYTVLDANSGTKALRLAGEYAGPVQLLITDVVMPEMGGRELVERLASLRPGIKVLYLSGYTDDAVVRYGILHADVAFLQKPFTMAALTNKVRQVLDEAAA